MKNYWLIIDKPTGRTSSQVVQLVRSITEMKKVGHGGTLDPLATGVLPIGIGREATKMSSHIINSDKTYEFEIKFGEETDTDDSDGKVIAQSPNRPTHDFVESALKRFIGWSNQIPPNYSAKKVNGVRAYKLARAGAEFELKTCRIHIKYISIIKYDEAEGKMTLCAEVSKGTYIRSIAKDLGRILDCYAHVTSIKRTRAGQFSEKYMISVEKLEKIVDNGTLSEHVVPWEIVFGNIPSICIDEFQAKKVRNGCVINLNSEMNGPTRLINNGNLVAIGEARDQLFLIEKVFNL